MLTRFADRCVSSPVTILTRQVHLALQPEAGLAVILGFVAVSRRVVANNTIVKVGWATRTRG